MSKIGVLSDVHLGEIKFRKYINNQNVWSYLIEKVLEEAIDKLISNGSEIIIIPGDLFDSPNPDIRSIIFIRELFSKIKIPIFILGGNHEWSQRQYSSNIHPFDIIDNVNKVYYNVSSFTYNSDKIVMIPYKFLTPENYEFISKEKGDILVCHGILDSEEEIYNLPSNIINGYKLIILGHIHTNNIIKTKNQIILTPGSIMPANTFIKEPKAWIYDTETSDLIDFKLNNSPLIFNYYVNNGEINDCLQKICNKKSKWGIYSIKYAGKMCDIDEFLYKKVSENSLNIKINTNESIDNVPEFNEIEDFWNFIKNNYPGWYDEFKCILNK